MGKPFAYVVDELDSTVAAYGWDGSDRRLRPMQILSSAPGSFARDNRAAEVLISRDGRFVFVSNRGHDSVGSFAVDMTSGLLTPTAWQKTSGRGPRFVTLDPCGRHLYAANELTDSIVQFAVDPTDGHLTPTGGKVDTVALSVSFSDPSCRRVEEGDRDASELIRRPPRPSNHEASSTIVHDSGLRS